MIVVGEASGDELGAELVRDLRHVAPEIHIFGASGPKMRTEGVETILESDSWSVVGVAAVAGAIPKFLRIKNRLRKIAFARKPEAVLLIDFPEFNLKLAKKLKADGHRVIYYVSPQVWAWRQYRYKTIRDSVDLLLSILPFEKSWYTNKQVEHVEFVGNPVALRTRNLISRSEFCEKYGLSASNEIIAILPGSRRKEIERHLETMLDAATDVKKSRPNSQFVIAASNDDNRKPCQSKVEDFESGRSEKLKPFVVSDDTLNLLNAADVAAVSSGTATLEAGVIGTPMVVVYRVPQFDAAIFRPFIDVPHFALINLISQKRLVTELVQNDFTSQNLSNELIRLLDPLTNQEMRKELLAVTKEFRNARTKTAAEAIVDFLDQNSKSGPTSDARPPIIPKISSNL